MSDPAFIAVLLVSLVVAIGLLVHLVLEHRGGGRKIAKLTHASTTREYRREFRFECTCGWSGWRQFTGRPISIKCPTCNGVAVQLDYRVREE